jgi:hypothetical protein
MLSHSKENQFIWHGNLFHGGTYFFKYQAVDLLGKHFLIAFENLSRSFSAGPPPVFLFSLLSFATADFVRAFKFFHKDFNCVSNG